MWCPLDQACLQAMQRCSRPLSCRRCQALQGLSKAPQSKAFDYRNSMCKFSHKPLLSQTWCPLGPACRLAMLHCSHLHSCRCCHAHQGLSKAPQSKATDLHNSMCKFSQKPLLSQTWCPLGPACLLAMQRCSHLHRCRRCQALQGLSKAPQASAAGSQASLAAALATANHRCAPALSAALLQHRPMCHAQHCDLL